jgi:hypothetical protein
MSRLALPIAVALLLLAGPGQVLANEIPCGPVEAGQIQIDGLLSDWKGVNGVGVDSAAQILKGRKDWDGARDLSFDVFCNHDDKNLFLALNVKDDYFIRSKKRRGDDHVVVLLGRKRLVIFPGDLRRNDARMTWGKRGKVKGITMVEALQKGGYSLELRLPYKRLPGFRKGSPSYRGAVWVNDSDSRAKMAVQTTMGTASAKRGRFSFAEAQAELGAFLRDKGYKPSQVRFKANADVVGSSGVEQVVLVGRTIGIVGKELPGGTYFYLDMPVKADKDVYWLKLKDLNGDRKQEIVTRYVERSGNGRREILAVFRFNDSNKFVRSFAHEILKGQGKKLIINRFRFKRRKRRRRKPGGVDLIFDKPVARGFTASNYREVPAEDYFSILLPWGEEKKRHFRFEGEEYSQK